MHHQKNSKQSLSMEFSKEKVILNKFSNMLSMYRMVGVTYFFAAQGLWFMIKVFCLVFQDDSNDIISILDKIVNTIDWIIGFCGGKYLEIFYELRTEIEIQKMAYLFDF